MNNMKYKILKKTTITQNDNSIVFEEGDIVALNDKAVEMIQDRIEPYEGDEPSKSAWVMVDPLKTNLKVKPLG
jgi:hypothetical protein